MAITPKSSWGWVKALLHSVHDQPDAGAVHAQFDRVIDTLAEKLPAVAEHLENARPDILAFTGFSKEIWRQIWSNNPNERLNRDPPTHRCRRDLPRPQLRDPAHRRRPGRATRRLGRRPPLPRTGRARALPHGSDQHRRDHRREGGPDTSHTHCLECSHPITRWPLHPPRPWTRPQEAPLPVAVAPSAERPLAVGRRCQFVLRSKIGGADWPVSGVHHLEKYDDVCTCTPAFREGRGPSGCLPARGWYT
jgi:hypothetical protein